MADTKPTEEVTPLTDKQRHHLALIMLKKMAEQVSPDVMSLALAWTASEAGLSRAQVREEFAPLIATQQGSVMNMMFGWKNDG
jgi:hypothetical protein